MDDDTGNPTIQRLDAIGEKLTAIAHEQRETTERISTLQHNQAEIKKAIGKVSAAVSATQARMADMARNGQELRSDFEAFRKQVDGQLASLETLANAMSSNVVKVLEIVEREELRRMRQLQLRNVVQETADFLDALKDRVVRYMAALRLQDVFEQHRLAVKSFDEIPDREYFENTVAKIRQAVEDATDLDREKVRQYREALTLSATSQKCLDELDAREKAMETKNRDLLRRIDALRKEAAEIRQDAAGRETAARRAARCAFLVSGALLLGAAGLGSLGFQDTLAVIVALTVAVSLLAGAYGFVKLRYTATEHAAECDALAAECQAGIDERRKELIEWQHSVPKLLGHPIRGGDGDFDLATLRVALNERRDAANQVCDAFAGNHPELRLIA